MDELQLAQPQLPEPVVLDPQLMTLEQEPTAEEMSKYLQVDNQLAPTKSASTPATDSVYAAKGALMDSEGPEDLLTKYKNIMWEWRNNNGYSNALARIESKRKENSIQLSRMAAGGMLMDGEIPVDMANLEGYKQALIAHEEQVNNQDIDEVYAYDAYSKDSPMTPEEEEEDIGPDTIGAMIQARARVQAATNRWSAENLEDSNTSFWTGVAESITPLMDAEAQRRMMEVYQQTSGNKVDSKTWFGVDMGAAFQAYAATGDGKVVIKEGLDKMYSEDPEKAERVALGMLDALGSSTSIIHKNDFSAFMRIQELLVGGSGNYNEDDILGVVSDQSIDNFTALLDIVGLGFTVKAFRTPVKTVKAFMQLKPDAMSRFLKIATKDEKVQAKIADMVAAEEKANMAMKNTVDTTAPTAPGNISSTVNQNQTRQMYEIGILGDDEARLASWGTVSKEDVVNHAYGFQPARADGVVDFRASPVQGDVVEDLQRIGNARRFEEGELEVLQNKIVNSYNGERLLRNMSSYVTDGENVRVHAVYGGAKGFRSVKSAIENAAFMMKNNGVRPENITVVGEFNGKLREMTPDELLTKPKKKGKHWTSALPLRKNIGKVDDDSARGFWKGGPKQVDDVIDPESKRGLFARGAGKEDDLEATIPRKQQTPQQTTTGGKSAPVGIRPHQIPPPVQVPSKYYIVVKMDHKISHSDAESLAAPAIKNNIFDKIFARWDGWMPADSNWGSLQQHLVDAASMFKDKFLHGASIVARDKEAKFEKELFKHAKAWQDKYEKLNKTEQAKVHEFIVTANRDGIRFDVIEARADGWSEAMMDTMADWRNLWDKIYKLENADMVKSLKHRGFAMYTDLSTNTHLTVRPVKEGALSQHVGMGGIKVFDVAKNKTLTLSTDEVKKLYSEGGMVAQLRRPHKVGDDVANYVVSKEKAGSGYIRKMQDNETVLPYREGYYSRRYTDNYFIVREVKDAAGNVLYERAVGSAKTQVEAELLTKRMTETDADGIEYFFRRDKKDNTTEDWKDDLHQAGGRSAQRIRGEQLETWRTDDSLGVNNIENPMEAMVHSIKSISQRVAMRDVIETHKARLMENYKDYIGVDKYGQPMYPSKASDIHYRGKGVENNKMLADARTLFNYIRSQEDGYVNLIDQGYKHALNHLAESIGNSRKFGSTVSKYGEKAVRAVADARGPIGTGKSVVSSMVLFAAPLRQFLVQSMQAIQLLGVGRPAYVFGGQMHGQVLAVMAHYSGMGSKITDSQLKLIGWTRKEFEFAVNALENSGQVAAIDKQNLVRGVLMDMADRAAASKFRRAVTAPLHVARRVGMDFGEFCNTTATFLTFLDEAKQAGKNLDDVMVMEDVAIAARNFSGNMNAAGDMPYNHNILSIPLQFAQIGHKMLMNMTFNQHLTKTQKARLIATNLLLFGVPAQQFLEEGLGKYLPEDPVWRNKFLEGIVGYYANETINNAWDSSTRIDFGSSFSATDSAVNTITTGVAFLTGGLAEKVAHSPVGSLVYGSNPRLHIFARELSNWVVPDPNLHPSDVVTTAKAAAGMFSGMSHAFKMKYILDMNRTLSAKGVTQDYRADAVAAVSALFGVSTMDESTMRAMQSMRYDNSEEIKEDIKKYHTILGRQMALRNIDPNSLEGLKRTTATGYAVFGYSQGTWDLWEKEMMAGAKRGEWSSINDIWQEVNKGNLTDSIEMAKMLPADDPNKERLIKTLEALEKRDTRGHK